MLAGEFRAYDKSDDAATVVVLFEATHGYRPAEIHNAGAIWLAGPLRDANGKAPSLEIEARRLSAGEPVYDADAI